MKKQVLVGIVGLMGTVAAEAGAQQFEGVVSMRLTAPGGPRAQTVEYLVRNGKVRMNFGAGLGGSAMIVAPAEKKVFMLMPAQNAYTEVAMNPENASVPVDTADVKMTRTGKTEVVAGLTCEHVTITQKTQSMDVCLTKALGRYVSPADVMSPASVPAWQRVLAQEFPLKVAGSDGVVVLEVTAVERKRLANDLFTVPSSYTKMQMPARRAP
jgi:hypothetical protein